MSWRFFLVCSWIMQWRLATKTEIRFLSVFSRLFQR
jgi:hypothetical protein